MNPIKEKCPCCGCTDAVAIVYGNIDNLSISRSSALASGEVMLGGEKPRWDWEEELIDTRCRHCHHQWHRWHHDAMESWS